MKSSTKLITAVAASVLGVAVAGGAAYAATGSMAVEEAPGQVLKVSGVGPASAYASETALANANANAKGLFGSDVSGEAMSEAEITAQAEAEAEASEAAEGETVVPVDPRVASKDASTVKGNETGMSVSAWAHANAGVKAVAPGAAVSVDASVNGRG